jgi:acyl carrier protein
MTEVRDQVAGIFREIFDDPSLVLRDEMTADDVDGWDSLAHINLIVALERQFGIRFATAEISRMKQPGQNVGAFLRLIDDKVGARA